MRGTLGILGILSAVVLGKPADFPFLKWEKYLTDYGYLSTPPQNAGPFVSKPLRTGEQIRNAIRNLQFFAGLKATGDIDEDTSRLLSSPRCGVSDIPYGRFRNKRSLIRRAKRSGNIQGERWSKTDLTWNLKHTDFFDPSSGGLSSGVVRRELTHALDLWSKDSALTFKEISGVADMEISFVSNQHEDGYPFDGPGSVLAHAFFPGSSRGGDIHFDKDETWSEERTSHLSRDGVASVYGVALHEVGHSLGLAHSPVETSIMFPWYSQSDKLQRLPIEDRSVLRQLYGPPKKPRKYPTSPITTTTTTPAPRRSPTSSGRKNARGSRPSIIPSTKIDKCNASFDAVAVIRSEMWVFTGRYFWRILDLKNPPEEPVEISSFWYGLPEDTRRVDALYETNDNRIMFFIGDAYYLLKSNNRLESGPTPLTALGLPSSVKKIDAVFKWAWNGKTFFFSGSQYWRFDDEVGKVELDYPRNASRVWIGVPKDIDSAFTFTDGKTYFFKGRSFWPFNNVRMAVERELSIGQFWMNCPSRRANIPNPFSASPERLNSGAGGRNLSGLYLLMTYSVIFIVRFPITN